MTELKAEFGQKVPALKPLHLRLAAKAVEQYPDWRVVPTYLGPVTQRQEHVAPGSGSPVEEVLDGHAKLWTPAQKPGTPSPDSHWQDLWNGHTKIRHSDSLFIDKDKRSKGQQPEARPYGLRYKTPKGRMLSRPAYLRNLLKTGDAVMSKDKKIWTFPLMKVAGLSPDRDYKQPADLYSKLNYIVSPEARLGVQVLHVMAGQPIHEDVVEITNETLSELKPDGSHRETKGFVGVTRSEQGQFFRLSWWAGISLPDWQLPQGTSSLQPAKQGLSQPPAR
jgi:hypothetical protein